MDLREHLERIAQAPKGPQVAAYFDLDGTLVSGYTASTFFKDRVRRGDIELGHFVRTFVSAVDGGYLGGEPTRAAIQGYAAMRGQTEETMSELGERLFVQKIARTVRAQARQLVHAHRSRGHTLVIASAASRYQIEPVARDLGIDHLVCTQLEVKDGLLTGRLDGRLMWGSQKAAGVRKFAREHGIALPDSFAYGNGDEDVAFLAAVGHPVALNAYPGLRRAARQFGWPTVDLEDPGSASPESMLRTLLAVGGLNVGATAGMALGMATRDRAKGVDLAVAVTAHGALRLAGVELRVVGKEHLPDGPAVYVANHQSAVDPVVVATVIPGEFTIIAKKEARFDPRSLVGSLLLDPAYIDRSDSVQARRTLDELVSRIQGGTSLLIFPEGTRSATPVPGKFRKGGFHAAIQAGVPVVPVVLRNTGDILPRHGRVIRPGVIDVAILEPIPAWSLDTLDEQVNDLHERFVQTLSDWPQR